MWSGRGFRRLISSPRWQTDAVSCLRSYSCVGLTISARSHHSLHDVDMPRETRPPGQTFTGAKATGKSSIGRVYAPNTSNLEHRQAAQRPCGSPRAACVIAATTPWRDAHCALAATVPNDPAFIDGAREALFVAMASVCVVVSGRCEGCASWLAYVVIAQAFATLTKAVGPHTSAQRGP